MSAPDEAGAEGAGNADENGICENEAHFARERAEAAAAGVPPPSTRADGASARAPAPVESGAAS